MGYMVALYGGGCIILDYMERYKDIHPEKVTASTPSCVELRVPEDVGFSLQRKPLVAPSKRMASISFFSLTFSSQGSKRGCC